MGVLAEPMMPLAALPVRVNVHGDTAEAWQVMEQLMADLSGNSVALRYRKPSRMWENVQVGIYLIPTIVYFNST